MDQAKELKSPAAKPTTRPEHRPDDTAQEAVGPAGATSSIPVIGLGGSAGALAALRLFFEAMPPESGAAFVVIPHLAHDHENLLPELLAQHTRMPVVEANDAMPLAANRIYVLPAGKSLSVLAGTLSVRDVSQCQGLRMPIDHFLCTLAADRGRWSIGVILSGTGKDGTQGLAEIRAVSGVTLAQDPQTAEFPEMPANAIAAGYADAVLAPEAMAAFLVDRLAEMARLTETQNEAAGLEAVLSAVKNATGHDFHCYKRATLDRRARRRMALHHLGNYDDYAHMIRTDKAEAIALRQDLLIGVTEFFRQSEAWNVLEEKIVVELIHKTQPGSTLRVWVPACSTGKEAYSVAMLLVESIERSGKKLALQVFATDADASAVDIARNGRYAEDDLKGLSQARLQRFCVHKNGRYEFVKELRSLIVFAPQDLTADPPFSKLDLITCRNLLIYLDQTTQRKIIQLFHFALRDGGYLFLGSAETVCGQDNLFEPLSQKWRMYRKLGVAVPVGLELPLRPPNRPAVTVPAAAQRPRLTLLSIANQALAERYAPAAAVVDRKGALLYTHGDVRDFLELPLGEHTGLLADAAREGMQNRLAGALLQAIAENKRVVVQARVKKDKKSTPVKVTVSPLRHPREADGLLLVTFEALKPPKAAPVAAQGETPHSDLLHLEDELKVTREELQSTIQQLEQSNEHMKASNEEVTAANEELQSANEELETSKEELQSLNEELNAVNARLQDKVGELEQSSNDVANLLTSGGVATLFLDKELKVRRFTQAVTKLLSLVGTDVGRPIADIHRKFQDSTLLSDVRRVLVDLTPATAEVLAENGAWYSRRILPYRTQDDRIDGVVVTFNEVTELKVLADAVRCSEDSLRQSEQRERERAEELSVLFEAVPIPIFIARDPDCLHLTGNRLADEILRIPHGKELSLSAPEATRPVHFRPMKDGRELRLDELPAQRAARGKAVRDFEFNIVFDDGIVRHVLGYGTPLLDEQGHPRGAVAALVDITDRKQAEEALRLSERKFALAFANNPAAIALTRAEDGVFLNVNDTWVALNGYGRDEVIGLSAQSLPIWPTPEARARFVQELREKGSVRGWEQDFRKKSGEAFVAQLSAQILDMQGQNVILSTFVDITARKLTAEALQRAKDEAERYAADVVALLDAVPAAIFIAHDVECRHMSGSRMTQELLGLPATANVSKSAPAGERPSNFVAMKEGREIPADELPVQKAARGQPIRDYQFDLVFADGRSLTLFGDAVPLLDDSGKPRGAIGAFIDITERKRAEDALRESEKRERKRAAEFEALMCAVPVGVSFSDDPTCQRITGNPAVLAQFAVRPEDNLSASAPDDTAPGRQVRFLRDGRPITDAELPLQRAVAENAIIPPMELEVRLPGGRRWFADASGAPVRDAQGKVIGGIAVTVDVTERKRNEDEIRRRVDELKAANDELNRFNRVAVDRELRMIELKKQVNELCARAGLPQRYDLELGKK